MDNNLNEDTLNLKPLLLVRVQFFALSVSEKEEEMGGCKSNSGKDKWGMEQTV